MPTATQASAATQETALSSEPVYPRGSGVGTTRHAVPLRTSASALNDRVVARSPPLAVPPTATQVEETHEIPSSAVYVGAAAVRRSAAPATAGSARARTMKTTARLIRTADSPRENEAVAYAVDRRPRPSPDCPDGLLGDEEAPAGLDHDARD